MATPETAFMRQSRGPRKHVSARIAGDVALELEIAAAAAGITRTALITLILEQWVETETKED